MSQAEPIINSFVAGELSPRLSGRSDVQQYFQSAAELKNMLVEFYGGARKAPGTYFVEEAKSFLEIDNMEYSTDLLARTAYVSNAGFVDYTEVDPGSDITKIADRITAVNYAANDIAYVYKDYTADYFDALSITFEGQIESTSENGCFSGFSLGVGVGEAGADASDLLIALNKEASGYRFQLMRGAFAAYDISDHGVIGPGSITYFLLERGEGSDTVTLKAYSDSARTIQLGNTLSVSGFGATKWRYLYGLNHYPQASTHHFSGFIQNVKIGSTNVNALQVSSEDTIKEQGNYSLKIIAEATESLNKTLTRAISSAIDLSGKSEIRFKIFASRTGGNIKIGIHDSGGTTSEKTYAIVAANAWEEVTWDISSVADADKNAIDSIIITITNADAKNTVYIDNFQDSLSNTVRIIPFVFSDTQAYIIEVGNLYMRFYKDNGQILSGGVAYEITTPYLAADLFELQFAQTADILYITHPDYAQRKLTRTGHTAWTLTAIDYSTGSARPALMVENITSTTITPSAATGTGITLTASASLFDSGHVGSIWKVNTGYVKITAVADATHATANVLYDGTLTGTSAYANWSEGCWSAYRGYPRSVTISEDRLIYGYTPYQPQTTWGSQIGAYDTFELGSDAEDSFSFKADTNKVEVVNWLFPANEILVGTPSGVSSLGTGSETTALTSTTGRMKKKVSYGASTILPQAIGNNVYYWQKYNRTLREYVYSLDDDSYVSNDATAFSDHITGGGIVDMAYQQSPLNVLWCVRADGKLAAFTRQVEQKVSAWTLHDTDGYYESVAVIPKDEYDEVWFVVRREIEGVTRRYIEYMVAPDFDDQEDMFFVHSGLAYDSPVTILNITRTNPVVITATAHGFSNGDTVRIRNVEGMTELNYCQFTIANKTDNTFELSGIDGTAYTAYDSGGEVRKCVNSVSGLDHLEGKTVQVLVDGARHADCVVTSGAISLDGYYSQVAAGLGYTGRIKTNDLEGVPGGISSQGKTKRVVKARVNIYRSAECKVGTTDKTDTLTIQRQASLPSGQATPVYTGVKSISFPSGWDTSKQIVVEQDGPLSLHVLSVISEMELN